MPWPVPEHNGPFSHHLSRLFTTQVELSEPKVGLADPKVELSEPKVGFIDPKVELSKPKVGLSQPKVGLVDPKVELSKPKVELAEPKVEFADPKVEPTYVPSKEKGLQKVVELLDPPKHSRYG